MLIIFDVIVLLMIKMDVKRYKSFFTPFSIISTIYLILINADNLLVSHIYKYDRVNSYSLSILLLIFTILFCVSYLFSSLFVASTGKYHFSCENRLNNNTIKFLYYVGLLSYFISLALCIQRFGIKNIKGNAFGIFAHLSSLSFIFAPLLIKASKSVKSKIFTLVSIVAMFAIAFMFGGKYLICINAIYIGLFLLTSNKYKFKKLLKLAFIILICGLIVFIIIYCLIPLLRHEVNNFNDTFSFAVEHFFYYLLSPIIGNNYALSHLCPDGVEKVFTVPLNILKAAFRLADYVNPIYPFIFKYSSTGNTNVAGLLGESVYCLGLFFGIVYIVFCFCLIYAIYLSFRINGRYKITTNYLLAVLSFSFFGNFFTLSGIILPLIFMFVFETYIQTIGRKRVAKRISSDNFKLERQ